MSEYIKNQATITYNDNVTETTEVVVTDIEPKIEISKKAYTCTDKLITHDPKDTTDNPDGTVGNERMITYEITVRNDSDKKKTNITVIDDLNINENDYEIVEASVEPGHNTVAYEIADGQGKYAVKTEEGEGSRITFDIPDLEAHTEVVLTYTIKLNNATVNTNDIIRNIAQVTDSENPDPDDPDTPTSEEIKIEVTDTDVKPVKQLMVVNEQGMLVSTTAVDCGDSVTYRITVPNPTPNNLVLNTIVDQFAALFNLTYTENAGNKNYPFDIKLVSLTDEGDITEKTQGTGTPETVEAKDYLVSVEDVRETPTDPTSKVVAHKVTITNSHTKKLKEGSTTEYEPLDKSTITKDMTGINIPSGYTLVVDIPGTMKCEKINKTIG